ncbi:unnamed protein product [Ostreobium quekettii]|uniref:Methyltransferase type 11 domain-containing protein n=1 Tax=Ostreobium quekettii TaxID=121088 RepID=A0A8S1J5G4_9CHLO|nr:unnamed protein product [Ostreobium quekettii]|eukprot:evm.model.scf_423.1 EVM.evm.TU.scf_423.1   scf_423:4067-9629(-)
MLRGGHLGRALGAARGASPAAAPASPSRPPGPSAGQHRIQSQPAATSPRPQALAQLRTCAASPLATDRPDAVSEARPAASARLACPICKETEFDSADLPSAGGSLACTRCARTFDTGDDYIDLTLTSGVEQAAYRPRRRLGVWLFSTRLVGYLYERGWRQSPAWPAMGFPGPAKEFEMAMEHLEPCVGNWILDVSCGSGVFSRRFAACGRFAGVIASDISGPMLKEAKQSMKEPGYSTPVVLVRADVGRLPFPTASLAAVHAGASVHCWPDPPMAFAEISRVLRPGGVLVASTVMTVPSAMSGLARDDALRALDSLFPSDVGVQLWREGELRDLCAMSGLQGFTCHRNRMFIMFAVTKPAGNEG